MKGQTHRFPWADGSDSSVWIVHFGSKSTPLIAQLCREIGLRSCTLTPKELTAAWQDGVCQQQLPALVILSGGDASVYDPDAPRIDPALLSEIRQRATVFGICYGAQLLAQHCGGQVRRAAAAEFGPVDIVTEPSFDHCRYRGGRAVMNHRDEITKLPQGWRVFASSERCRHALVGTDRILAVQFHPEMDHTEEGDELLRHVAFDVAGCRRDYSFDPQVFVGECRAWMTQTIGRQVSVCGLSGGVDSSVAFTIARSVLKKSRLLGIFIDTGWYRERESEEVRGFFGSDGVSYVDASQKFHTAIERIPYPTTGHPTEREHRYYEDVRRVIGNEFVDSFIAKATWTRMNPRVLIQGTNAADVIESNTGLKSHHNVSGLPVKMAVDIVEPLAGLYKFEIRRLAAFLGLPEEIVHRQPFPGPGLAVRSWGPLNRLDAEPLRRANGILEEVIRKHYPKPADRPCQYYCALAKLPSTGLMGDSRVIGYAWWVRLVEAGERESYATLGVFEPTPAFRAELSHRLTTEVVMPDGTPFVRVAIEITGKPPSTVEPH